MNRKLQDVRPGWRMSDHAALAGQMIEATQIPGSQSAKRFLVQIDGSNQAFRGANEKNDRLIPREKAYTSEKELQAQ
jgi:hypothetical protein